ncbi:hypothetical protein ISS30_07065 [bacterium]|nr:hypothetical protein [bacterium]
MFILCMVSTAESRHHSELNPKPQPLNPIFRLNIKKAGVISPACSCELEILLKIRDFSTFHRLHRRFYAHR